MLVVMSNLRMLQNSVWMRKKPMRDWLQPLWRLKLWQLLQLGHPWRQC